jgi:hypothetical protein
MEEHWAYREVAEENPEISGLFVPVPGHQSMLYAQKWTEKMKKRDLEAEKRIKGILHRYGFGNFWPGNVMVHDGRVKVVDSWVKGSEYVHHRIREVASQRWTAITNRGIGINVVKLAYNAWIEWGNLGRNRRDPWGLLELRDPFGAL